MKKITIVVPCYNAEKYIGRCFESLKNQTIGIEQMELVFVDDASTDDTWKLISEYERQYPENIIAIHCEENGRQGRARNIGMSYATTNYIGFVDADDWVEADMFDKLWKKAEETHFDIIHCGSWQNFENGEQIVFESSEEGKWKQDKAAVEGGTRYTQLSGGVWANIYRKSFIVENKIYFPEELKFEDNFWRAMVSIFVKSIYNLGECKYHYCENRESTVRKKDDPTIFDRLIIEKMKLEMYRQQGVYERFYSEIREEFVKMYFCNTILLMAARFEEPSYQIFLEMQQNVKKLFPDYQEIDFSGACSEPFDRILIKLIGMEIKEDEFRKIIKKFQNY